jgi:predicted transcriptional regulator
VGALVFSIKPRWIEEILEGRKVYELRRRPPKLARATPALLYETSPSCHLRAVCLMGPVVTDLPTELWERVSIGSCVSREEFDQYFAGFALAHAITVHAPRELAAPISLARLRKEANFIAPQSWNWASEKLLCLMGTEQ